MNYPCTWETVTIGESLDLINGRAFKPKEWSGSGRPIIRIQNLNNPKAAFNYYTGSLSEKFSVRSGDLLFAWSGTPGTSFGAHVWKGPDAWLNQHIFKVVFPTTVFDKRFLQYAINQNLAQYIGVAHGGAGLAHITKGKFEASTLPLPPLPEQKRIVAKIEELFSELEAGEASLRKARRQLGVYRQSLLKQAFEGKLTEKWRTQNRDRLGEPLVASAKLDAEPSPLPSGWIWQTLNDVAEITGGLTKNSKRDSLPLRIPYLRVANVYADELRLDEIKDIGVTPAEAKKVRLVKGDLLIVEGNGSLDQIGRVAAWNGSISDCGHQNHLIRARCHPSAYHDFVLMFLLSPHGRDVIEKQAASTSGLHTLSVSKVQRLPVPLCSLPEQKEIVRILDEQFEAIERNERELDAALKRSEALRQSILKRAFSGRLVPQDPADEPASAVLARLRAESRGIGSQRRGRKNAIARP